MLHDAAFYAGALVDCLAVAGLVVLALLISGRR